MYPEVIEFIEKIEYVLGKRFSPKEFTELEHLSFEFYNDTYINGMRDSYSAYDESLLETFDIKQKI